LTGGNGTGALVSGSGGAIFVNGGSLRLDGVYVKSNSAGARGGGVIYNGGTNHRILNSTFFDNAGASCGGFHTTGPIIVVNSTFSGNRATSNSGGAICLENGGNTSTFRNVTVTNNAGTNAGGLSVFGELNIGNTIVAGNTTSIAYPEISYSGGGAFTSAGGNLFGSGATFNAITYHPTDIRNVAPLLGPLTIINGGSTPTHALLTGSPSIDKGLNANAVDPSSGNAALVFDQRGTGYTRIFDGDGNGAGIVDIGAYERLLGPTAAGATVSGRIVNSRGRSLGSVMLMLSGGRMLQPIFAKSSAFGYYRFDDVQSGETYDLTVVSNRYNFTHSSLVINVVGDLADVNFIGRLPFETDVLPFQKQD
jgi:hypothetical protein